MLRHRIDETIDIAMLIVRRIAWVWLSLVLLGTVPSAIAVNPTNPLAADQESDRAENLDDAVDAALDAAEGHRAAKAPPKVPREFSLRINAPLYYNSNAEGVSEGQAALQSDPDIALGWSRSLTSLPFKLNAKLKASADRYANVPQAAEDQASGSFKLSYSDASDDQVWAPFFSYNSIRSTTRRFRHGSKPRTTSTSGFDKLFNFDGDFRLLPATASSSDAAI